MISAVGDYDLSSKTMICAVGDENRRLLRTTNLCELLRNLPLTESLATMICAMGDYAMGDDDLCGGRQCSVRWEMMIDGCCAP